jgi:hypothetical protein
MLHATHEHAIGEIETNRLYYITVSVSYDVAHPKVIESSILERVGKHMVRKHVVVGAGFLSDLAQPLGRRG